VKILIGWLLIAPLAAFVSWGFGSAVVGLIKMFISSPRYAFSAIGIVASMVLMFVMAGFGLKLLAEGGEA
jgi:hypothetical protein